MKFLPTGPTDNTSPLIEVMASGNRRQAISYAHDLSAQWRIYKSPALKRKIVENYAAIDAILCREMSTALLKSNLSTILSTHCFLRNIHI